MRSNHGLQYHLIKIGNKPLPCVLCGFDTVDRVLILGDKRDGAGNRHWRREPVCDNCREDKKRERARSEMRGRSTVKSMSIRDVFPGYCPGGGER